MRLYVAGPVTGRKNFNQGVFEEAKKQLEKAGHEVIIPHDYVEKDMDWATAMRVSLTLLLRCEGVALLPDWQTSKGASIEWGVAFDLGIPSKIVNEWIYAKEKDKTEELFYKYD